MLAFDRGFARSSAGTGWFESFQWHGDVFDLPAGVVPLAHSELTELQAFRFGPSTYGLLLHLEATAAQVAAMAVTFAGELEESKIDEVPLSSACAALSSCWNR